MLFYFVCVAWCEARPHLTCAINSVTWSFKRVPVSLYRIHDFADLIPDLSRHVLLFLVCVVEHLFYEFVQDAVPRLGIEDWRVMAVCGRCELNYFLCIARFYENDDASRELLREHGVLATAVQWPTCNRACILSRERVSWSHVVTKTKKMHFFDE